ncbi:MULTISPECIES: LysE family transporter [unclassified Mesorhizobium]|uniref:LysE family transporter n=1 Tax=unclassified Mesorhizobium TaxID=325217 RepID=UPI0013E39EFA|nr:MULTISPECIES: LysE family transporter [unclassified Mesorhizobium]
MKICVDLILAILPIHFAVMVSPGPNSVLLLTTALSSGRSNAMRAALGIAIGSLVWMVGAMVGVSVILEALPALGLALKIAGGGYLIYLGVRLWKADALKPGALGKGNGSSHRNYFRRGLVANLTNPKSAAYFGSIFAAFLTKEVPVVALAIMISLLFLMSIAWHGVLATTFSTNAFRAPYLRHCGLINRITGAILAALGVRLAASASLG